MGSPEEARVRLPQLRLVELLEERGGGGAAGTAVRVVGEAAPVLGFAPGVRMEGLLDTDAPKETADHVVAVLSEALTDIARHAGADRADVFLNGAGRHLVPASRDASLVVVGRKKNHAWVGDHIGPVTHAVLQHASAPVAVVPHD